MPATRSPRTGLGLVFWRFSRILAVLLVPYIAWVSFAGALNFWLWRNNVPLLG